MKKIKATYIKHRNVFIILFAAFVFLIAVANLYFVLKLTIISNDECLWVTKQASKDSVAVYFDQVKVNGVTWNAGIRDGDVLLKIDGVDVTNTTIAQISLNKHKEGDYAKYTYRHKHQTIETKVYVKKLLNFGNLGISLLGFIWFVVGFIVVMAKPDGKVQRLFYRIGCGFVLYLSILLISNLGNDNPFSTILPFVFTFDFIWSLAGFGLPFMIVYFFWSFPKPFKIIERKWLKRSFIMSAITLFTISYLYRWLFLFLNNNERNLYHNVWITTYVLCSLAVISIIFLLILLIFHKPIKLYEKRWPRTILVIYSLLFIAAAILFQLKLHSKFNRDTIYQSVVIMTNILIVSGLITGLVSLFINYNRLQTKEEKKPLIVILFSYTLGIAALIYSTTIANIFAGTIFNSPEYYMPIILVVIIPISFAYSIFRYQLMDVSVVVKNTIIYGAATATIAIIYYLLTYVLGQSIGSAVGTEYRSAIAAAAFIIFALVFQSTKDKFQELLTRKFYPEQFTYQKVILKFSNDVVGIVGLENILDSMKDTFVSALKINQFGILLRENKTTNYLLKRSYGLTDGNLIITDRDNLIEKYILEELALNSNTYIEQIQFSEILPDNYEQLINENVFTIIPMVIKSKVIGLLIFGLKLSGSQFAGKDLELLSAAANQAAVSIENARLYESEAQKLTLERDLDNARKIQEGLLPKQIPQLNGLDLCGMMIPAMQVGGDYFDVIQVSPSKIFVIVGDVSGKGLSASLYMSKLQTMVQLYCRTNRTPREVLIEINRKIYESIERNWFITVNLALIDTDAKTIKFCRAGHSPLLVVNHSAKTIQSRGIGLGLEIGKIFEESLEEIELKYKSSEIYTFFSDGISEAMNENNDLFGIDELSKVISMNSSKSAKDIMKEVMSSIEKFRGRREQNDDITIVLVKML